jgi:hypothetical protein
MHIPKDDSIQRNDWFKANQLVHLNAGMTGGLRETEYVRYDTLSFTEFLNNIVIGSGSDYLRIYFGSNNHQLDLIYAVENINSPGTEFYYRFDKGSGKFVQMQKGDTQTKDTASYWVNEFNTIKYPLIIQSVPSIKDPTRACRHEMAHIVEFLSEINAQQPSGIKAYFASYTDKDTNTLYPMRMFVNFVFTSLENGQEKDVFIDDCPVFPRRNKLSKIYWMTKDDLGLNTNKLQVISMFGWDNATLCPPDFGCIAELTLP